MRISTPITPYEQSQLCVFVEIDVALKWRHPRVSLEKKLSAYLDAHLCHILGQDKVDDLYKAGWTVNISADGNCFVVKLMEGDQDEE